MGQIVVMVISVSILYITASYWRQFVVKMSSFRYNIIRLLETLK